MRGYLTSGALALAMIALLGAAAPEKPPAQYLSSGTASGGTVTQDMLLTGIRFGEHEDYIRMVVDFAQQNAGGLRQDAPAHPVYSVEYREYPYRLVVRMQGTRFDQGAHVDTKPALPFSIVTQPDGTLKEMQIFLKGPSEFKVIEIDDPAKLSIDVRPQHGQTAPTVYTVQLVGPANAGEAYALVEAGRFPEGCHPSVIVLGDVVVVEQAFTDGSAAQAMDTALRGLGYVTLINERKGNELPQL
jgi:hypothetical protein